ncbi:hypothetical protein T4D_14699 [Trichinella pseudospiralis]|uniref:Uncharacterized protein n=1 Tax=Trichinella pseudospiralis TaxID=6337 RepID=A0A0V1FFH3_TRIPS|nr:hypothetical protein T4D_14699 [Trichinella pseudospiralis]
MEANVWKTMVSPVDYSELLFKNEFFTKKNNHWGPFVTENFKMQRKCNTDLNDVTHNDISTAIIT